MVANRVLQTWKAVCYQFFWWQRIADQLKITGECVMYMEKHVLVEEMFTNEINMGFSLRAWIKKTVNWVQRYWFPGKDKVPGATVSREGYVDSVLGYERTHHYWFLCKRFKITFYYKLLRQNSLYLLNDPRSNTVIILRRVMIAIQREMRTSSILRVSKLDWQTCKSEFESHWVPYSFGLVPHLSKTLSKLQHRYTARNFYSQFLSFTFDIGSWVP